MLNPGQLQQIKSLGTPSPTEAMTPEQAKASFGTPKQSTGGGFLDTLNSVYQNAIVKPSENAAKAVGNGLKDFGDAFHEVQSAGQAKSGGDFINKAAGGALDMAGAGARTVFNALGAPVNIATGAAGNIPTGGGKNVGDRANDAVKAVADKLGESKTLQGISQIPGIDKHVQSLIDVATPLIIAHLAAGNAKTSPQSNDASSYIKKISDTTDQLMQDPDLAGKTQMPDAIKSIQNDIKVNAEGGGTSIPAHQLKQIMALDPNSFKSVQDFNAAAQQIVSPSSAMGVISSGLDSAATKIADTTGKVEGMIPKIPTVDVAGLKDKIFPTPTIDEITGQVAQGKASDVPNFQRGLSSLDTSNVKTYADLGTTATSKIKELAAQQDEILGKDTTPRKVQQLALQQEANGKSVAHNYVLDAVRQLKELYTKTNDPVGLQEIKDLETKLNPTKGKGLTIQEVNNLARQYGSEFGTKAFNKTGDPITSVNAQAFENTRTGVKKTARGLLPDEASKQLDAQMTDLYTVQRLSDKMATKVQTLSQRLQKPSVLQKVGGYIGSALRVTGVGDLAGKLLGIDKVPGAKTLDAVELESRLSKNLSKIDAALKEKDDAAFAKDIGDILNQK